jgi:hypothetical protein
MLGFRSERLDWAAEHNNIYDLKSIIGRKLHELTSSASSNIANIIKIIYRIKNQNYTKGKFYI